MMVFEITRLFPHVDANDEIAIYKLGRFLNSSESMWKIFGYFMHERDPPVIHLAVHLELSLIHI